jgi:beta-lactamase regulating signal transducer with metallopeptidase domain
MLPVVLPIVLDAAVRSAMLLVVVLAALKALRVSNPHVLMAAWQMVLIASLSMPFLVALTRLAAPPPILAPVLAPVLTLAEGLPVDLAARIAPTLVTPVVPETMAHVEPAAADWLAIATWLYLAVAGWLALRWLLGCILMWRLCRSAAPVCEDWAAGRDVRTHPAIAVPATFGSTILLPLSHASWDATRRRAVLAHEHAHVHRADFYLLALASLNRAVFWFSPLAWWLHNRIADLAEARSDAAAIQDIGDRVRYAEILLDFAGGATRSAVTLAMARTRTVRRRVEHILGESIMPSTLSWRTWGTLAASIVPLTAIAAGAVIAQVPAPVPVQSIIAVDATAARRLEQERRRTEVFVDPKIFDNYVGYYQLDPHKVFTVVRLGDRLQAQLTGQDFHPLYPESPQKFFYKRIKVRAQISFTTDLQGRATALTLHQSGMERIARRVEEADAKAAQEAFARRLKEPTPQPGSEAALRRQIEAFQQGQPAYHEMSDALASVTRPQLARIQRRLAALGALQSTSFRGVAQSGLDVYEAKFENGLAICRIYMGEDGKILGLLFQW